MTHIPSSAFHYRLNQEALAYRGECSICAISNQDLYSMHQIENELYDISLHGPILKCNGLSGVFKAIDVATTVKKITLTLSRSVFHQVAKGSDDNLHLFSPAHNACHPCIGKIKKLNSAQCPLCRLKLPLQNKPKESSSSAVDHQRRSFSNSYHLKHYLEPDFLDPYIHLGGKDKSFNLQSRSQKKTTMHHFVKKFNHLSSSKFFEDVYLQREDREFEDSFDA
jgi:hypothetical protein